MVWVPPVRYGAPSCSQRHSPRIKCCVIASCIAGTRVEVVVSQWLASIVHARWLVASLGEAAAPPWWRSQAATPAGIRFLERLYPRTALVASLETAGRAACLVHDASLARVGHYHLFRLSLSDEAAIREWLRQPPATDAIGRLAGLSFDDRLRELAALAGGESMAGVQGPVSCGPAEALRRKSTLQRIAAAYAAGLRDGRPVYPYLEVARP